MPCYIAPLQSDINVSKFFRKGIAKRKIEDILNYEGDQFVDFLKTKLNDPVDLQVRKRKFLNNKILSDVNSQDSFVTWIDFTIERQHYNFNERNFTQKLVYNGSLFVEK